MHPKRFQIRKAELRDAATLAAFNQAMAQETEGKALEEALALAGSKALLKDGHKGFYLVAEQEGEIIGQLMVTPEWSDWRDRFFWWVQSVYVRPQNRGQGVYTALYQHVVELARYRRDVAGIRLYVERHNQTARSVQAQLRSMVWFWWMARGEGAARTGGVKRVRVSEKSSTLSDDAAMARAAQAGVRRTCQSG
jgi:GNAT superfamily N-acetyltransferase